MDGHIIQRHDLKNSVQRGSSLAWCKDVRCHALRAWMHSGVLTLYQHRQLGNLHNTINPSTHIHTLMSPRTMSDQAPDPTAADGAQSQAHDEHAASHPHEEHHTTRPDEAQLEHEDANAVPPHPSTANSASQPAQPLQRPDAAS